MNFVKTSGGILTMDEIENIYSIICEAFRCDKNKIEDLQPLQKGLTNSIFSFRLNGGLYVFRYPGLGSEVLIDRGREALMQQLASDAGVDSSVLLMSMKAGWRIGKFINNIGYDYHNLSHVVRAIELMKKLHNYQVTVRWELDIKEKWENIKQMTPKDKYGCNYKDYPDFASIRDRIYKLYDLTAEDGIKKCLVHGDCRDENFLINKNDIFLIDWEYAGYGDPGYDIGSYIAGGKHTRKEVDRVLFIYFGRQATIVEQRHFYSWIAITSFFYMHWCMFKESKGQKVGYLKSYWYDYAKEYSELAIKMFGGNEE